MAIEFTPVRTITVAGFAAEADPNSTAPATSKTFDCPGSVTGQGKDDNVMGIAVKFVFTTDAGVYVAGGTVDFTGWYQDARAGGWASLTAEAAAPGGRSFVAGAVARWFHQVTALTAPGGGTKLAILYAPRTS